jgi:hypothetical protein
MSVKKKWLPLPFAEIRGKMKPQVQENRLDETALVPACAEGDGSVN